MDDEVGSGGPTCANPGAESQAALRQRASSLETLNAVADAVHRSLDVGTVARDAIDALRRYKPFSAASILALSEDGENLLAVADEGFNPDMVRERIPVEGSLVGLAVRRATVVTTDDLSRETRGIREMREALVRDGFRGVTIVPLIHSGRPLGVMALVLPGEDRLTAEERETLLAVGKTVALAMDNARQAQELREKELRYTLATEAAKVGVWDWNIETGDFYLDPNLKALLGYSDDEIPNDLEAWSTHIHPDDRARVESTIAAHIEGRAPQFVCEHRMLHKDGSKRWILARGNGMRNSEGKIVRVVGTDFDITVNKRLEKERRELEQQMLHAEKLKSLGVLSGGIAHEFNNLLTAILGNAGLAHRSAEPGSTIRRRIEQIEAATQRAAELTRQLLAYSGRGTFVLKPIDASGMIREMSDLLRVSVSKKAELIFECPPGQPLMQGDPGQIRQLVLNLVTNASEALGEESGSVVVRTSAAEGSGTAGHGLSIEVSDTGCGIPEQDHARIYEPFFTTKFTGRGLGLAAVHGIVRGHQGSIEGGQRALAGPGRAGRGRMRGADGRERTRGDLGVRRESGGDRRGRPRPEHAVAERPGDLSCHAYDSTRRPRDPVERLRSGRSARRPRRSAPRRLPRETLRARPPGR